jgi:hypothetical protein
VRGLHDNPGLKLIQDIPGFARLPGIQGIADLHGIAGLHGIPGLPDLRGLPRFHVLTSFHLLVRGGCVPAPLLLVSAPLFKCCVFFCGHLHFVSVGTVAARTLIYTGRAASGYLFLLIFKVGQFL